MLVPPAASLLVVASAWRQRHGGDLWPRNPGAEAAGLAAIYVGRDCQREDLPKPSNGAGQREHVRGEKSVGRWAGNAVPTSACNPLFPQTRQVLVLPPHRGQGSSGEPAAVQTPLRADLAVPCARGRRRKPALLLADAAAEGGSARSTGGSTKWRGGACISGPRVPIRAFEVLMRDRSTQAFTSEAGNSKPAAGRCRTTSSARTSARARPQSSSPLVSHVGQSDWPSQAEHRAPGPRVSASRVRAS